MQTKFITFEGIDGAGKSSHIEAVRDCLTSRGFEVICTREPGGTALGESIRALFLNYEMSPETETLLVFAARREHLRQVVWPALARGAWVLCDRFTDATYAYQGGGRALGGAYVAKIAEIVHPGFSPALTLLFDLPPDAAHDRIVGREALDRIESEAKDFHERVRAAYLALAEAEPSRIAVLDSREPKDAVRAQVIERVLRLIGASAGFAPTVQSR